MTWNHLEGKENIQAPPMYATCCKKFNSMNILQHCRSDFVAEPDPGLCMHRSGFTVHAGSKKKWCVANAKFLLAQVTYYVAGTVKPEYCTCNPGQVLQPGFCNKVTELMLQNADSSN